MAHESSQITLYQRTPNMCIPMNQRAINPDENERLKEEGGFEKAFHSTFSTFAGFTYGK